MKRDQDEQMMRRTIRLSIENVERGGGPFAALVVKEGKVLAEGVNQVTLTNDPTAHAEINAIRMATKELGTHELKDCILYSSCEPCPMCFGAIYWAKIPIVYFGNSREEAHDYGFDDSNIYRQISLPAEQRTILFKHILPDEAIEAFRRWDQKGDKILY